MNQNQERRFREQLKALGLSEGVIKLVFLEVNNTQWNAYGLGYQDCKEGKERLDNLIEPGW